MLVWPLCWSFRHLDFRSPPSRPRSVTAQSGMLLLHPPTPLLLPLASSIHPLTSSPSLCFNYAPAHSLSPSLRFWLPLHTANPGGNIIASLSLFTVSSLCVFHRLPLSLPTLKPPTAVFLFTAFTIANSPASSSSLSILPREGTLQLDEYRLATCNDPSVHMKPTPSS